MSTQIPPQPSLEYLKKQAKALLKAHKQSNPVVIPRLKKHHPRLSKVPDVDILDQAFTLRDAQLIIAHEYGFASWPKLSVGLGESGKPPCSFCGCFEGQVQKLFIGPGVHICDGCVRVARDFLHQGSNPEWKRAEDKRCSFCAHSSSQGSGVAARPDGQKTICTQCLEFCVEALEGKKPEGQEKGHSPPLRLGMDAPVCSICGKSYPVVRVLPRLPGNLWLCSECVTACQQATAGISTGTWKKAPESKCTLCQRTASYGVELVACQDGRACLCSECTDLMLNESGALEDRDFAKITAYFRRLCGQLAEKHRADDPEAVRRVNDALPQWRDLSSEEIRKAPLDPVEAYHVWLREWAPEEADGLASSFVHEYVAGIVALKEGEVSPQPHLSFLEDQASKLVEAHRQGHFQAARRIKMVHPEWTRSSLEEILMAPFTRAQAQIVVAREFGMDTWSDLLAKDADILPRDHSRELQELIKAVVPSGENLKKAKTPRETADAVPRYPSTEQILLTLIQSEGKEIATLLSVLKLKRQAVEQSIERYLEARPSAEEEQAEIDPALHLRELKRTTYKRASQIAREMKCPVLGLVHYFLALIEDPQSGAAHILTEYGVDFTGTRREIERHAAQFELEPAPGSKSKGFFSDEVKRVMQYAREESDRLRHEHIGTEDLLLGILKEGRSKAITVLTHLELSLETMRRSIEDYVTAADTIRITGVDVPFTPRANRILKGAADQARELGTSQSVDVEHLLLALLKDKEAAAAQILDDLGVNYEMVRGETLTVREETAKEKGEGSEEVKA